MKHTGLSVAFVAQSLGHCIVDCAGADDAVNDRLGSLAGADQPRVGLHVGFMGVGERAPYCNPAGLLQAVDAVGE